jgi:hypothetical protein
MKIERLKLYIHNPYSKKKYYIYYYDLRPEIINEKIIRLKKFDYKIITAWLEIKEKQTGEIISKIKINVNLLYKIYQNETQ